MEIFSKLLHEKSKANYRSDFKEADPASWPKEWKTTYYKEYKRFPSISLPETKPQSDLFEAIANRRSNRNLGGDGPTLEQLSGLLKYACGEFEHVDGDQKVTRRAQPSGGGRYPIEAYLLILRSPDVPAGVYHYNVKLHQLDSMWSGKEILSDPSLIIKSQWAYQTSALLVFTGVFWRSQNKYGARGYRLICIEVGAIIQNLYLVAQSLGLKCVAFSGTHDDNIEKLLDLDPETESLVMSALIST